mgnify:CR=1 FL=1
MKYKYKINGLDCANCTQKLEDALNKKEEINDCVISFATGMMTFDSNQEINDNELLSFMQSIEDEVTIDNLSTNKTHHHDECSCGHHHEHEHHHDECGCGHHHEHVEDHRELANSIKFNIVGLDCANCAAKMENAISKLDDVENVSISFMTTKMVLKADEDKMDAVIAESEKIIKKIEPDVVMKPKA